MTFTRAQSIAEANEVWCAGFPDSTLAILAQIDEAQLSREALADKLRLEGEAYMLKSQWDLAKDSFHRFLNATKPTGVDYSWMAWKHALLAKTAYWEIHPYEAYFHADSALYYLDRSPPEKIYSDHLFRIWTVAVQAYKQALAENKRETDELNYAIIDSLSALPIEYLADKQACSCYLAKAWHVRGNSFTDRIKRNKDKPELLTILATATEAYEKERALLSAAYGDHHVNIPMSWLTTILAHSYAGSSTAVMDDLWREGFCAYYPSGASVGSKSRESEIMFLTLYNEFLFNHYDELDSVYVFERHKELDRLGWESWLNNIKESQNKGMQETHALYFLQPALIGLYAEMWKFENGFPYDIELIFECIQYVQYYNVLAKQSGTVLPPIRKLSDFQASLQEGELVLDFFLSRNVNGVVFVIDRSSCRLELLPPSYSKDSEQYRQLLITQTPDFAEYSFEYYQGLKRLIPELDRAELLTVSYFSHKPGLPFETLVTQKPELPLDFQKLAYLINRCDVRYLLSPAFTLTPTKAAFSVTSLRPEYTTEEELPFAKTFDEKMSRTYPEWRSEKQLSLREYLTTPSSILHLSLHARNVKLRPKETMLDAVEQFITLDDISSESISAHLAVVNACNSANGRMKGINGAESPARHLMESGAQAIISNLWEVDDQSSHRVLTDFYALLAEGTASDLALAEAKRKYIQGVESRGAAHPYYWSAAKHIGAPLIAVRSSETFSTPTTIIILILLACLFIFYIYRLASGKQGY